MTIQEPIFVSISPEDIKEIVKEVVRLLRFQKPDQTELTDNSNDFLTLEQAAQYLSLSISYICTR